MMNIQALLLRTKSQRYPEGRHWTRINFTNKVKNLFGIVEKSTGTYIYKKGGFISWNNKKTLKENDEKVMNIQKDLLEQEDANKKDSQHYGMENYLEDDHVYSSNENL